MDANAELIKTVRSREALRFEFVDEQSWDTSCGYAALATLLARFRGHAVSEAELLLSSVPEGGAGAVKVSLAELARLAGQRGFEIHAWRVGFDELAALLAESAPLLVHYDRPQGHFALLLSVGEKGVVTADPARGLELLTRDQFLGRWSGIAACAADPARVGESAVRKVSDRVLARADLQEWALSKPPPKR